MAVFVIFMGINYCSVCHAGQIELSLKGHSVCCVHFWSLAAGRYDRQLPGQLWLWLCCISDVHRKITGISSAPTQVTCVVLTSSLTQSVARNCTPPYVEVIDQLLRAGYVDSHTCGFLPVAVSLGHVW